MKNIKITVENTRRKCVTDNAGLPAKSLALQLAREHQIHRRMQ